MLILSNIEFDARSSHDDHFRMSLIIDVIHTLINYIYFSVNLKDIEILVKVWIMNNQIYDLLLEISWMKKIEFNFNYVINKIIINDDDDKSRQISIEIFSLHVDLFIVEIDNDKNEKNAIDAICQTLFDEQKNFEFWLVRNDVKK